MRRSDPAEHAENAGLHRAGLFGGILVSPEAQAGRAPRMSFGSAMLPWRPARFQELCSPGLKVNRVERPLGSIATISNLNPTRCLPAKLARYGRKRLAAGGLPN
jgi:hypothetical protein